MSWKTPNNIIDRILAGPGSLIKDRVEKAWNELEEKDKAKVVTLKNGHLILNAKNSAWLQELTYKREEIKQKLNRSLGGAVKDIRLRLG
jgi:chaperonin cofactor prefoldin